MDGSQLLVEAAKLFGLAGFIIAIMFVQWIIMQKASKEQTENINSMIAKSLKAQSEQSNKQIDAVTKSYERILNMQDTANNRNFDLMKEILELQRIQTQQLSRVEVKIDSM